MIYARHAEESGSVSKSIANHSAPRAIASTAAPILKKKYPKDEESQMKLSAQLAKSENEEPQMKPAEQLKSNMAGNVSWIKNSPPPRTNNTGLPDNLKTGIENLSGFSMDDVIVHYNSDKPVQLNALAYAQGSNIHIAPRQEKHLSHEAWHVVQQKQGKVRPMLQAKGIAINDDKGLESEADVMGEKAAKLSPILNKVLIKQSQKELVTQFVEESRDSNQSQDTFIGWVIRNKLKLIAAGVLAASAVYALYKHFGGAGPDIFPKTYLKLFGQIMKRPGSDVIGMPLTAGFTRPRLVGMPLTGGFTGPRLIGLPLTGRFPRSGIRQWLPISSSGPTRTSSGFGMPERHAWPLGKKYGPIDKIEGLISLIPGAALGIELLKQIVKREPNLPKLIAEIIKLHPYARPLDVYDKVSSIVVSRLSRGESEIGQTEDLLRFLICFMINAIANGSQEYGTPYLLDRS